MESAREKLEKQLADDAEKQAAKILGVAPAGLLVR